MVYYPVILEIALENRKMERNLEGPREKRNGRYFLKKYKFADHF